MNTDWSREFDVRHGDALKHLLEVEFPLRHNPQENPITYGTSGFRTKGDLLPPVVFRVCALVVSRSVQGAASENLPVGVILTASHNHYADNGMKLLGTEGEFLETYWEPVARQLGNSATYEEFKDACWAAEEAAEGAAVRIGINSTPKVTPNSVLPGDEVAVEGIRVHTARDTRRTGLVLLAALQKGCDHFGAQLIDHGVVSTPLLHDVLYRLARARGSPISPVKSSANKQLVKSIATSGGDGVVGDTTLHLPEDHRPGTNSNYYRSIVVNFTQFYSAVLLWRKAQRKPVGATRHLIVDCANGVGTITSLEVIRLLAKQAAREEKLNLPIKFHLVNTDIEDPRALNRECGADILQKTRRITPELMAKRRELMMSSDKIRGENISIYTLDGDADRVVAFYIPAECGPDAKIEDAELLDGDRIIVILTAMSQRLLSAAQLTPNIGVVQTAYANGASTRYITNALGVPSTCSPTGTKYSHHLAANKDIGVYFESNGHGTILFEQMGFLPKIKTLMRSGVGFSDEASMKDDDGVEIPITTQDQIPATETPSSPVPLQRHDAAKFLYLLSELASQSCGDAMADIMAIETCLAFLDWTFADWFNTYTELPSNNLKVELTGIRGSPMDLVKTTTNQSRVTHPIFLQEEVDRLVDHFGGAENQCRSFIRPSGTEPIVRVYAEATTQEVCDQLVEAVANVAKNLLLS